MNIAVYIDSIDKTSLIEWESFKVEDNINNQPNICSFIIKVHAGQTYKPTVGDEVIVTDDSNKIFAGYIISINHSYSGEIIYFDVVCKDYTVLLDRTIVIESYNEETVDDIIANIVSGYLSGVTVNNVNCSTEIKKIVFNRKTVSECLRDLANLLNYIYYIDYDKDIHFVAKNVETALFNISDDSQYLIGDSLSINNDLSQLKNVVIIRGGDKVATSTRSKTHTGDDTATVYNTDYKFASKPTVTVAGSPVTVGTENLETTGYDCFWDYNQKYIRFDTAPTSGQAIVIEGYPLIPIIVQVEDITSIEDYGRYEFSKVDKSLKSTDDAKLYAQSELESYGNGVREGSFRTYQSGLISGQTININLSDIGINENFIIQRTSLNLYSRTNGEWLVEIATTRTMGIIQFLQDKVLKSDNIELNENEVLEKFFLDNQTVEVTEEIGLKVKKEDFVNINVTEDLEKDPFGANTPPDFVLCPYTPTGQTDPKREFVLDRSYLG